MFVLDLWKYYYYYYYIIINIIIITINWKGTWIVLTILTCLFVNLKNNSKNILDHPKG